MKPRGWNLAQGQGWPRLKGGLRPPALPQGSARLHQSWEADRGGQPISVFLLHSLWSRGSSSRWLLEVRANDSYWERRK